LLDGCFTTTAAPIDRSSDNKNNSSNRIIPSAVVSLPQQHQSITLMTIKSSAAKALFARQLFHCHSNTN